MSKKSKPSGENRRQGPYKCKNCDVVKVNYRRVVVDGEEQIVTLCRKCGKEATPFVQKMKRRKSVKLGSRYRRRR